MIVYCPKLAKFVDCYRTVVNNDCIECMESSYLPGKARDVPPLRGEKHDPQAEHGHRVCGDEAAR